MRFVYGDTAKDMVMITDAKTHCRVYALQLEAGRLMTVPPQAGKWRWHLIGFRPLTKLLAKLVLDGDTCRQVVGGCKVLVEATDKVNDWARNGAASLAGEESVPAIRIQLQGVRVLNRQVCTRTSYNMLVIELQRCTR